MFKVKRFTGFYPDFTETKEIEEIFNRKDIKIVSYYQEAVTIDGKLAIISTFVYQMLDN